MIGKTLGHCRILEKIGSGGMGEVYRAHDESLDRDVAVKLLLAGSFSDPAARARLLREARTASQLNHPHICTIHEVGEGEGQAFIVMELVEGEALSALIPREGLPAETVIRYGAQIADALAHAHKRGIVHRDVKPSNVIITPDGQAKVLDFGLAARYADKLSEVTRSQLSLEQAGEIVGTLAYLAPEILRGEPASARSDVWALGGLLYNMASGSLPFGGRTGFELSSAILREPPAPLSEGVAAGLRTIIQRCLAKEPRQRYEQASEVRTALETLAASTAVLPAPIRRRVSLRWLALGASAALLLAALLAISPGQWRERLLGGSASPRIESLAVLPLENLSRDPEQEYFADGMTEELIAQLAKISALRVISRTSAMRYKGTNKALPDIAKELSVDAVVEGSVQHSGDRVRVTAQLIHGPTDKHLWAETYERDLRDVLALQSDVARAIASQIRIKLTVQEQAHLASARPVHPEAHEAYLMGRYHLNKGTREGAEKAIEYFEESLRSDPNYAVAHAGVARAYTSMSALYLHPGEALPKAKAAAMKALDLDPSLAEAHASLGVVRAFHEWEWAGAEEEFRRALELNPNSAAAHLDYGSYLAAMGRDEEASREARLAWSLDPLSRAIQGGALYQLFVSRRYDRTIEQCGKVLEVAPNHGLAYAIRGLAYAMQARFPEAIADGKKGRSLSDSPVVLAFLGDIYAMSGKRTEAEKVLQELLRQSRQRYVCQYSLALVYVSLGDLDKAFEWLNVAFQQRND